MAKREWEVVDKVWVSTEDQAKGVRRTILAVARQKNMRVEIKAARGGWEVVVEQMKELD